MLGARAILASTYIPNVSFFTSKINSTTINTNPVNALYIENTSTTLNPRIWFQRKTPITGGYAEQISFIVGNKSRNNDVISNYVSYWGNGIAINNNRQMYSVNRNIISKIIRIPLPDAPNFFDIVGTGVLGGAIGYRNGRGYDALFNQVNGIAIDSDNIAYIADSGNNAIRKMILNYRNINFEQYVEEEYFSTLAGPLPKLRSNIPLSDTKKGCIDGSRAIARFNYPKSICVDLDDNIYVTDTLNHTIRKITKNGLVLTIAGLSGTIGKTDGVGSAARFNNPYGICCDFDGNIFVSDGGNKIIRKITKTPLGNPTTKQYADLDSIGFFNLLNEKYDFGDAITMNADGNVIAISAPKYQTSSTGGYFGAIYIYKYNEQTKTWQSVSFTGQNQDRLGSAISMNAAGNILAATSLGGSIAGVIGYVKVYRFDESTSQWNQMGQTINGTSTNGSDQFGCSVSINSAGDRFVVGIRNSDSSKGSVKAYSWNSNTSQWVQLGQTVVGTGTDLNLGKNVSINSTGDRFVTTSSTGGGEIKVYNFNQTNSTWELLGQTIALGGNVLNASTNATGDKIVAGTFIANGQWTVRVYSFNQNTSQWTQLGSDIQNNFTPPVQVLINNIGDRILISNPSSDVDSTDTGSVMIYDWDINSSQWVFSVNVDGHVVNDFLGRRIAINASGNRFAASTYYSGTAIDANRLYVYAYESNKVSYTEQYEYNVTTFAGSGDEGDSEGDYLLARFTYPKDIKMMNSGDLIVIDGDTSPRLKRIKNSITPITNFNITLSSNHYNLDLGYLLRKRGWNGESPVNCTLTILSGVYIYSAAHKRIKGTQTGIPGTTYPALFIESTLNNSTITIINSGGIIGAGGTIEMISQLKTNGTDAIETKANITLKNYGIIGGGGGAGGAVYYIDGAFNRNILSFGGGGAGFLAGRSPNGLRTPNPTGFTYATILSGGNGSYSTTTNSTRTGGRGGDLGQHGSKSQFTGSMTGTTMLADDGSIAGYSIRGISFVTIDPSSTGTMYGLTI
jgi:hypothetical protein